MSSQFVHINNSTSTFITSIKIIGILENNGLIDIFVLKPQVALFGVPWGKVRFYFQGLLSKPDRTKLTCIESCYTLNCMRQIRSAPVNSKGYFHFGLIVKNPHHILAIL